MRRVLVVDTDEAVHAVARRALRGACSVDAVATVDDALPLVRRRDRYALVLHDAGLAVDPLLTFGRPELAHRLVPMSARGPVGPDTPGLRKPLDLDALRRLVSAYLPSRFASGTGVMVRGPRQARVLIVDHAGERRGATAAALQPSFDVWCAASGPDALALIAKQRAFDVVLAELDTPGFGGIDLFRAVRARSPEQAARIVLLGGDAIAADDLDVIASVPIPFLPRPLAPDSLRAAIESMHTRTGAPRP